MLTREMQVMERFFENTEAVVNQLKKKVSTEERKCLTNCIMEEEDEVIRGSLAWKCPQRESYGDRHARLVQLSSEVTNPTAELRNVELGEAIDRWFAVLSDFEELQGAKMTLPVAMGGLMNFIPAQGRRPVVDQGAGSP